MNPAHHVGPSWFEQVKGRGVAKVAAALGLHVSERTPPDVWPCPSCHAERRSSSNRAEKRGPVGIRRDGTGWHCHRCDATGDAVTLAALVVAGSKAPSEWGRVRERCADVGLCDREDGAPVAYRRTAALPVPPPRPAPVAHQRAPAAEVEALWSASLPVNLTGAPGPGDLDAIGFLSRRKLFPLAVAALDVARFLPQPAAYTYPAWWPAAWALTWRVVVCAYEPDGRLGGLHARAVTADASPKTRWPKGVEAAGLLMADARGAAFLRGELAGDALGHGVLVVEGLTDLVAAALWMEESGRRAPVLAVTSGCPAGFHRVKWPAGVVCRVATDNDRDGEKYAKEIRAALPASVPMRRIRLGAT